MQRRTRHPDKAASASDAQRGDSGIVALEFALTAPLLLLVMLGTMAFALHFAVLVAVIHAASEGARASIGGLGNADRNIAATQRVQGIFQSYGPLLQASRATVAAGPGADQGTYQVTVNYDPGAFDISGFYRYWAAQDHQDHGDEGAISYTATVANGGY